MDGCLDYNCVGSELGHLWYIELGNIAPGPMTNTGKFVNLTGGWYGTPAGSFYAYYFDAYTGRQIVTLADSGSYAMAVHPGDVGAVPEPETCALMLGGLVALALARRQRQR